MELQFTFRNIEATDALKSHVTKRVNKVQKYIRYPVDVHVYLSLEKTEACAEMTLHAEHKDLVVKSKSQDLYESIDQAVHKLESRLKKERDKKKNHGSNGKSLDSL